MSFIHSQKGPVNTTQHSLKQKQKRTEQATKSAENTKVHSSVNYHCTNTITKVLGTFTVHPLRIYSVHCQTGVYSKETSSSKTYRWVSFTRYYYCKPQSKNLKIGMLWGVGGGGWNGETNTKKNAGLSILLLDPFLAYLQPALKYEKAPKMNLFAITIVTCISQ
jgi:hypothetical protein